MEVLTVMFTVSKLSLLGKMNLFNLLMCCTRIALFLSENHWFVETATIHSDDWLSWGCPVCLYTHTNTYMLTFLKCCWTGTWRVTIRSSSSSGRTNLHSPTSWQKSQRWRTNEAFSSSSTHEPTVNNKSKNKIFLYTLMFSRKLTSVIWKGGPPHGWFCHWRANVLTNNINIRC